jgi:purine-binding chemotaxis protein CheW
MTSQAAASQYLTFTLAEEQYAVTVSRVREVLEVPSLTKVPGMPAYMRGVINIRGSVVPVVDLRLKFDMQEAEHTVDTSIIVMDIQAGSSQVVVGCLADSVQEVIDLPAENIEPAPRIGTTVDASCLQGMGKRDEGFIIVLDIDRVFQNDELEAVEPTPEHATA